MESLESQLLQKLQNTQKREAEVFTHLEKAIKESMISHKERLDEKRKKNEEIRRNYKMPPSLSHLQEFLNKTTDSTLELSLTQKTMARKNQLLTAKEVVHD